jgi:hypothetical protein
VVIGAFIIQSQTYIRYDIVSTLFLALALFLYSLNKNHKRWWLDLFTGISVGLCINGQPVTYCFGLAFALFYLWQYIKEIRLVHRWFWLPFWLLTLGGAIALAFYVLVIVRNTSTVADTSIEGQLQNYASVITSFSLSRVLSLTSQYINIFLTAQPILSILALVGIVVAFLERKPFDLLLLILYIVWTSTIIFTYFYFSVFYITPALPFLLLFAARGMTRGISLLLLTGLSSRLLRAVLVLLVVWLFAPTARNLLFGAGLEDVVDCNPYCKNCPERCDNRCRRTLLFWYARS